MIQALRRRILDRMVLQPSRHPIEFAPQRRVMLDSGGRPLECFVRKNFEGDEPPELLVLKFPGTGGRAERSTEFPLSVLSDVRTMMWTWNPPGYGRSGGRASLSRIADVANDFWNQVTERHGDQSTRVWLCANSLGCVTALHVAASMQPDRGRTGVIMRNAPPLIPVVKRVAERYPLGRWMDPVVESLCDPMNAMLTARRVNLPAVFMQSELDTLVPLAFQNQLVDAYLGQRQVVLMEGLSHADLATEEHAPLIKDAMQWLWQHTGCKSNENAGLS
jgi:pimeloyl-ACP methyl ester carboxylesterase